MSNVFTKIRKKFFTKRENLTQARKSSPREVHFNSKKISTEQQRLNPDNKNTAEHQKRQNNASNLNKFPVHIPFPLL